MSLYDRDYMRADDCNSYDQSGGAGSGLLFRLFGWEQNSDRDPAVIGCAVARKRTLVTRETRERDWEDSRQDLKYYHCPVCHFTGELEPCYPLNDANCPRCNMLLWPD